MGGAGSGAKPRIYPPEIVALACELYASGKTVAQIRVEFPKGYRVQSILERHLPERRRSGKRDQVGALNDAWKGADVGYAAAHYRLRSWRGEPSTMLCIDCGLQAHEWSYARGSTSERVDHRGCSYSTDVTDYDPRCKSCHTAYDRSRTPDGRFAPRVGDRR